jgi:hypothetical protein
MNNSHVPEPFQSLLDDICEATQTLANCAAKGALKPDGTRMPPKPLAYDLYRHLIYGSACEELAETYLDTRATHGKPFSQAEKEDLAQTIQNSIEDWFLARESLLEEQS